MSVTMTPFYEPLSHLDASFLALETPTTHMHVAGVVLFDGAELVTSVGGLDIGRIKSHIDGKLGYIPRYRQRLAWAPPNRRPV
ncbi:MAG: wax ester/triacylglycerol synthase domain-containing protein, partial [Acidimicrobiia bacterium]